MKPHYYSTQTHLADKIAQTLYEQYYVFVAEEFDPSQNHPTSNPKTIREVWCKVSSGDAAFADVWFDHREKLKKIALKKLEAGDITEELKNKIHLQVIEAGLAEAQPMVYLIPQENIAPSRVMASDFAPPDYPKNVEHIILDLKDSDNFTKDRTACGKNPAFLTEAE